MELAAVILSVMALLVSLTSLVWQLAKHFSTHQIQMMPVDNFMPGFVGAKTSPIGDEFKELGEALSPEEKEYFDKRMNAKK